MIQSSHRIDLASTLTKNQYNADITAQLVTPCAAQALSSPLHLIGLDLYNNPARTSAERLITVHSLHLLLTSSSHLGRDLFRMAFVRQEYVGTTLARMGRIFPAYGIGGVVNKFLRKKGKEFIGEEDAHGNDHHH